MGMVFDQTKNKAPFISVMILCFNYGEMLNKALEKCAEQSFRNFEIIIINNGSTDCTQDVYLDFCKNNPNIQITYVPVYPNQGPIHGWKAGLAKASGEYVMFCDADDWMEPNCLKKLAERARETNADRVVGRFQEVGEGGKILRKRVFSKDSSSLLMGMLQGMIFRRSIFVNNNWIMPDDPFFSTTYDVYMVQNFAVCENSNALVYGEPIYNYYFNPGSAISKALSEQNDKEYLKRSVYPIFSATSDAMKRTNKIALRGQFEYLAIVHYYSIILLLYMRNSCSEANSLYNEIRQKMINYLPCYQKNIYLKPIHNGYDQPVPIACWVMSIFERLRVAKALFPLARLLKCVALRK